MQVWNVHAPTKKNFPKFNKNPFMTKQLRKAIMWRSRLKHDCKTEHAQSWHLVNHAEKNEWNKKLRIFNFLGGFSRKKIIANEI